MIVKSTTMSYEEKNLERILRVREVMLNQVNKKIEDKIKANKEIDEFIKYQENIITSYLDTFDLPHINKYRVLSVLLNARVKKHELKKRCLLQSIQALRIHKDTFIKQSQHDENIETAFKNADYRTIIELWCDKYDTSYNSLDKLFLALQFFLEARTIKFIKKYSNMGCILNHIDCVYSIQIITSEALQDRNFPMYKDELSNTEKLNKLKELLLETKNTFRQFILYVYGKYFPQLTNDILEQIIDYNYINYTVL